MQNPHPNTTMHKPQYNKAMTTPDMWKIQLPKLTLVQRPKNM